MKICTQSDIEECLRGCYYNGVVKLSVWTLNGATQRESRYQAAEYKEKECEEIIG